MPSFCASAGEAISTELLVGLLGRDARLAELGVHHRPREAGRQSGTSPRVVARALRELIRLRRRLGPGPERARRCGGGAASHGPGDGEGRLVRGIRRVPCSDGRLRQAQGGDDERDERAEGTAH